MNTTTAVFSGRRYATAQTSLYQWDYGQLLIISGLDLPSPFEAHFCNDGDAETVTMLGNDNMVTIPDQFLTRGKSINAYIYLHTGDDDGETEYKITIPVLTRPQPSDIEPTPVQQDAITQAIAALNNAVNETAQSVIDAAESEEAARLSEQAAKASEESAALSETNAAASATAAANSASAASDSASASAESARDSAASASASAASASASAASAADSYRDAERAEQAANNAGYLDIEIVDGNLIYTRTDAVDVDFVLNNGHLIMEVI